jgi:hypothetical protein
MAIRIVNPPEASAKPAPKPAAKCGCIFKLIEAQQSLRLQHWLTTSHAEHKTLGKAYEGLDDLIDTFVEAALGAKGRGILSPNTTLTVGGDASKILSTLEGVLRNEIPSDIGENETSLMNIRDEMLALVQKTRYLLTQK